MPSPSGTWTRSWRSWTTRSTPCWRREADPLTRPGALRDRTRVAFFLSPWILGTLAFVLGPVALSAWYAFTNYDGLSRSDWIGLDNFRFMFTADPFFWRAVRNTLWIVGIVVPLQVGFSVLAAVLLARPRRGSSFYRMAIFLPALAPAVGSTLAFTYLLDPSSGPVNALLGKLGLGEPLWFHDPAFAKPGLALLALWTAGPSVLLLLASARQVPADLYDMVATERAGTWQRFRLVTLPQMRPVIEFVLAVSAIAGLQYFTESYVVSGVVSNAFTPELGSPEGSTLFYSVWMYQQGFRGFRLGYASAMSWLLLVVALVVTALLLRRSRRSAWDEVDR